MQKEIIFNRGEEGKSTDKLYKHSTHVELTFQIKKHPLKETLKPRKIFACVLYAAQLLVLIRSYTVGASIFLLSEHILRKKSITTMKKFDFENLTYLYVFSSPHL